MSEKVDSQGDLKMKPGICLSSHVNVNDNEGADRRCVFHGDGTIGNPRMKGNPFVGC